MIDRPALRRKYEAGVSAWRACKELNIHNVTAYRWYRRWLAEDGGMAPTCGCGRPIIHRGRCGARKARQDWAPPYRGPVWIGKPMTPEEAEKLAR